MNDDARTCTVCSAETHPLAYACRRCKRFIDRGDIRRRPNRPARIEALRKAWDGEGFRCHYSGIRLDEENPANPRYLTFDHRTPGLEDDIVIAAQVINDMKSDLSEDEFIEVVKQLACRFSGGEFDDQAFNLKHWKR